MQIEIKARNGVVVTDELRAYADHRFEKIDRQVSEHARLELELSEEHNPAIAEHFAVDAVLHLKGNTLRASEHDYDMRHAIHMVSDELQRQLEKHRAKRSHRREAQRFSMTANRVGEPIQLNELRP